MAVSDRRAAEIARWQAAVVGRLAQSAFDKLWAQLGAGGVDPQQALQAAQLQFGGAFAQALAKAFSDILVSEIGVAQVRDLPVGGLSLSRLLYLHNEATAAECLSVIRTHAQGVHQARELAMRLYDGYNPSDGIVRPLEGRARAELPKALRILTSDPKARSSLAKIVEQGQEQAARLKTQALRAAYSETFEAWKDGAGEEALKKRLDVAYREKNRYFANRISQTELARAHQAQVAVDLMDDEAVEVVQVRINPAHPKTDICDLHARADLWGLGPGNYPKAKAPRPPFHPFCWCRVRSMPSLDVAGAELKDGGEAAYLRSMPIEQAARVMGSRERAEAVLGGQTAESVINAGKDPLYRLARVGDPVGHPLVKAATPSPHP